MVRTLSKALIAFLLLGTTSLTHAQEPDIDAGTASVSTAKQRVVFESLVGYGGIGFRGGIPKFTGDADIKKDASPRLSGDLAFAYVYDDDIVADLNIGYAWNRLGEDKDLFVVTSVPMTIGARYLFSDRCAAFIEGGWRHVSNAGIASRNLGLNSLGGLIGVSLFY